MFILLVILIGLQGVTTWKVWKQPAPAPTTPPPTPKPNHADVEDYIRQSLSLSGLNCELPLNHNLVATGKLGEVLYHASVKLGREVKSLQDLHDLLVEWHG